MVQETKKASSRINPKLAYNMLMVAMQGIEPRTLRI